MVDRRSVRRVRALVGPVWRFSTELPATATGLAREDAASPLRAKRVKNLMVMGFRCW